MSEEKIAKCGFKIKWADKEIEYYGDDASALFKSVFEHVKNIPVAHIQPSPPTKETPLTPQAGTLEATPALVTEGEEYDRIMKDADATKEQVLRLVKFEKRKDFSEMIPCLPSHPPTRDAVVLISYALQLGLRKTQIEVTDLKKIMREDGYPLLGHELGSILADFRRDNVTITSQTKGLYKPFSLGTKGLNRARMLLKSSEE